MRVLRLATIVSILLAAQPGAGRTARRVALTFDDLPGLYVAQCDPAALRQLNTRLVEAIRRNRVPALGLVVEGGRCEKVHDALADLLEIWLSAGLGLGNHTYSHLDANATPLETFEQDIVKGETTLRPLLARHGLPLRYFRFPMLRSGNDAHKKGALEAFLAARGYTQAVVTVDNDDYIFARVYADALAAGDRKLSKRIAAAYIPYMESMFAFYERLSRDTLGYEPPQIVLLHDHQLNADHLDELVAMLRKRGYSFITVEEALRDPAYRRRDTYVGGRGISAIQRWALTAGKPAPAQPEVPSWIDDLMRNRR